MSTPKKDPHTITIAVTGCSHGSFDTFYRMIELYEEEYHKKVDLLIVPGDLETIRNQYDLNCVHCPPKYLEMGDFFHYYSGKQEASVPTIIIGGNHEAANYLQEECLGGYLAKNIFYMGNSNVINFGGLRIGGISGIHKYCDAMKGYYERPPYDSQSIVSINHTRRYEIDKFLLLKEPLDIMISHDWPDVIYKYGNTQELLKKKPHFSYSVVHKERSSRNDIKNQSLGSPSLSELLFTLRPKYWFAAHLHVKFPAIVRYDDEQNPDIKRYSHENHMKGTETKFLALDKPLPRRHYIQFLDIPVDHPQPHEIAFDREWLAILKSTYKMMPTTTNYIPNSLSYPTQEIFDFIDQQLEKCQEKVQDLYRIPEDYYPIVPFYHGTSKDKLQRKQPKQYGNPQMDQLLEFLGLDHKRTIPSKTRVVRGIIYEENEQKETPISIENPEAIDLDSLSEEEQDDSDSVHSENNMMDLEKEIQQTTSTEKQQQQVDIMANHDDNEIDLSDL